MATSYYTDSDSPYKPDTTLPTFHLCHTTPNGREFSYTLTRLTLQCFIFEADHSAACIQFASTAAFQIFWSALKARLNELNPAPESIPAEIKLLPAVAASLQAAPAEHVIRISEMVEAPASHDFYEIDIPVSQKISEIEASPEYKSENFSDLNPVDPAKRLHQLINLRRRAFDYPFKRGNAGYRRVLVWLRREIVRREAEVAGSGVKQTASQRVTFGQACEYCHKADLTLAMAQFERKYGRKVTHIRLSKYDHIPADVDVTGIEVSRMALVLPGDCWLGGAR